MVKCVCGKEFATEAGIKQHIRRRYCRGPNPSVNNICQFCNNEYKSYAGLRQHMKQKHPQEYNLELEEEVLNPIRAAGAWSDEEVLRMAQLELEYTGRFINKHLLSLMPTRTLQSIKSKRTTEDYKTLLQSLNDALEVRDVEEEIEQEELQKVDEVPGEIEEVAYLDVSQAILQECSTSKQSEPNPDIPVDVIRSFLLEYRRSKSDWEQSDLEMLDTAIRIPPKRDKDAVCSMLESWLSEITAALLPADRAQLPRYKRRTEHPPTCNKQRRAMLYRKVNKLYRTNRKYLADCVLDNVPIAEEDKLPGIAEVEARYSTVFGTDSLPDNEPISDIKPPSVEVYKAFTEDEIQSAIISSTSSSPGPDGLRLEHIKALPLKQLVILFNVMFMHSVVPTQLTRSRTTLIPKSGTDTGNVDNWRPITISSILLRICHKILAKRMSNLPLHSHQRGFRKIDGVLINNITVDAIIRERRRIIKPTHILSLDVKKAFDTVSHHSVYRALRRFSVDERVIDFIREGYSKSTTKITVGSHTTRELQVLRGVRQGDPLSPLLFNLMVDELITKLELTTDGLPVSENLSVAALGYADDILLFSSTQAGARRALATVSDFLGNRGLTVNPSKCAALSQGVVPAKKKLFTYTRSLYLLHGKAIPQVDVLHFFKYLGQRYNSMGQSKPMVDELKLQLMRLYSVPLKPMHKLTLLKYHLIPRYIHKLQSPRITHGLLRDVDKLIRIATRKILHLNKTCADAYLHAPLRTGGLGIFSFVSNIPRILKNRVVHMAATADMLTAAVLQLTTTEKLFAFLTKYANKYGNTAVNVKNSWTEKLQNSYCGNGLQQGSCSSASSSWIHNPPQFWSGRDYVQAILLRGNLLPTKGIPSNPAGERKCRAGCNKVESLSHVLQGCSVTHWHRIKRHDRVVTRIRKIAEKKGWLVEEEPRIRLEDGRLKKPDLIVMSGDQLLVTDIAIHWEGPDPLQWAHNMKVAKYSEPAMLHALAKRYPGKEIMQAPLIIGARGTWSSSNATLQNYLNLSKQDIQSLVTNTINGSILIHRDFMRLGYYGY